LPEYRDSKKEQHLTKIEKLAVCYLALPPRLSLYFYNALGILGPKMKSLAQREV